MSLAFICFMLGVTGRWEKLLFTFTVFISQDIVTENKGIEADWAQSTFFSVNTLRSFSI